MAGMDALTLLTVLAAAFGMLVPVAYLEQVAHRRAGLLPSTPRLVAARVWEEVLRAVPLLRVRHDALAFEDGSGLLLVGAEPEALTALGRLASREEVRLVGVFPLTRGLRLCFAGATGPVHLDVEAAQLASPERAHQSASV